MRGAWPYLRAHRAQQVVISTGSLALVLGLVRDHSVGIGVAPVRMRWLILLGILVVSTIPLSPQFGVLHARAVRRVSGAGLRVGLSAFTVLFGITTAALTSTREVLATWALLLAAVGFLVATVAPDHAWAAILTLGSGSIVIDHLSLNAPVSQRLEALGDLRAGVFFGAAALICIGLQRSVSLTALTRAVLSCWSR